MDFIFSLPAIYISFIPSAKPSKNKTETQIFFSQIPLKFYFIDFLSAYYLFDVKIPLVSDLSPKPKSNEIHTQSFDYRIIW